MALRKGVDFLAFYDGDEFIGINYGACTDRLYFGLYIAIVKDKRSGGYGSQIIDAGEPYSIMIDRETLDVAEYKKAVSKLSFGLVRPKIQKR